MAKTDKTAKTGNEKELSKKQQQVQHNKKMLLEALEKSLGIVTSACKAVNLDRTTFYNYCKDDAEFKAAVDDVDNIALDFAESQLHKQIQNGVPASTIFYLKTKGKNRGYVERIEQTGAEGGAIQHSLSIDEQTIKDINAAYDGIESES